LQAGMSEDCIPEARAMTPLLVLTGNSLDALLLDELSYSRPQQRSGIT
jgi:hypothetical protein